MKLLEFLHRLSRAAYLYPHEELTGDEQSHRNTFVTSILCSSVEKTLRNRIAKRTEEALSKVGTVEGQVAVGKVNELQDILLEWQNLRDDLQQNPHA